MVMVGRLPQPDDPKQGIVRVLVGEGPKVAGTGFLLLGGMVATCAHVVQKAADLGEETAPDHRTKVFVEFPFAVGLSDNGAPLRTHVAEQGWDLAVDIAILKIEQSAPYENGCLRLADFGNGDAFNVFCFGFGESVPVEGDTARALVPNFAIAGTDATLHERGAQGGALFVEPGYSGAPVCSDDEPTKCLGMLRATGRAQGLRLARMVLVSEVKALFGKAWAAESKLKETTDADDLAPLFTAVRDGINAMQRTTNQEKRVIRFISQPLDQLEKVILNPDSISQSCKLLGGIERRWREASKENAARFFSIVDPGDLITTLDALIPKLKAAAEASGDCVINNDVDDENLPHAAEVWRLLDEIEKCRDILNAPVPGMPESTRHAVLSVLAELESMLGEPTLSLAELDRVRAELERLDRDVLADLIRKCQVILGRHVNQLPDLAVFRDLDEPWCPEMVVIPSGSFLMGSPEDEEKRIDAEGPLHRVEIGYRFALGRYAVTFEEYDHFCEATGREKPEDRGWGRGRRPVINVSWHDAQDFCAWLSREIGAEYRLPSEAEWEYACRAGTTTPFSFGATISTDQVNYDGNFPYGGGKTGVRRKRTVEVGGLPANPWGLYEMHGNVWQWCQDHWHDSYDGAPGEGLAWEDMGAPAGAIRVVRGGSWNDDARYVRSAYRGRSVPGFCYNDLGFRFARDLG